MKFLRRALANDNLTFMLMTTTTVSNRALSFIWLGGGGSIRRVETECSNRRGEVAVPNGAFWGVSQGGRVETEQTPPEIHLFTLLPAAFAQNGVSKRPNK
ncbi:hypothetical protein KSP39_PZI017122 [Platanthera zijinensis]|uniref:Uncharacterized protein n=1 Tax=Platanthera zijinensis TaxID=2320716 RepID=A0AAP0FZU8_9ASPA